MVNDFRFHSVGLSLRLHKSSHHKLCAKLKLSWQEDAGEEIESRAYLFVVEHSDLLPWAQNGFTVLSSTLTVQKLSELTLNVSSQHITPVGNIIIIFIFNELLE